MGTGMQERAGSVMRNYRIDTSGMQEAALPENYNAKDLADLLFGMQCKIEEQERLIERLRRDHDQLYAGVGTIEAECAKQFGGIRMGLKLHEERMDNHGASILGLKEQIEKPKKAPSVCPGCGDKDDKFTPCTSCGRAVCDYCSVLENNLSYCLKCWSQLPATTPKPDYEALTRRMYSQFSKLMSYHFGEREEGTEEYAIQDGFDLLDEVESILKETQLVQPEPTKDEPFQVNPENMSLAVEDGKVKLTIFHPERKIILFANVTAVQDAIAALQRPAKPDYADLLVCQHTLLSTIADLITQNLSAPVKSLKYGPGTLTFLDAALIAGINDTVEQAKPIIAELDTPDEPETSAEEFDPYFSARIPADWIATKDVSVVCDSCGATSILLTGTSLKERGYGENGCFNCGDASDGMVVWDVPKDEREVSETNRCCGSNVEITNICEECGTRVCVKCQKVEASNVHNRHVYCQSCWPYKTEEVQM